MVGISTVRNLGLWSSSERNQSLLTEPPSARSKPGTVAHHGSDSEMALGTREQNLKQSMIVKL